MRDLERCEADVGRVAVALWRQDAERAAPNVAKMRTPEAFRELDPYTVSLWASQARAAIAAMKETTDAV